ncbi:hypothetical protein KR009_005441 [Drosophila setifemur]|nr:hypothetical protein KR009_005441 [Drosophila setifemur]
MSKTLADFYQTSQVFWRNLVQLVLQCIQTICWNHKPRQMIESQTEKIVPKTISDTMDSFVEEQQKRIASKAQEYAKVELLHRLLVQQQLQDLERRRIIRLALARKRLEFSN